MNNNTINNNEPYVQTVLEDSDLYLLDDQWFKLLQDEGAIMTDEEITKFQKNPKAKFTRKTIGTGINNNKLYEGIYRLAEEVFKKMEVKQEYFRII